jgi:hypothetical protein
MTEKTYTLKRDGEPDLRIAGELLGDASSHSHQGPKQNRWEEVTLYRTKGGKYAAAVTRRSQWQGENDTHTAVIASGARELLEALEGEDVVDLAKEALSEAGVEAAEDLE